MVGGATLDSSKAAYARDFVQRAEFVSKYQNAQTAESLVDALLQSVQSEGLDLGSERGYLIAVYNQGTDLAASRAAVIRYLADHAAFKQSQYNRAFVLTEYFAYLQRDIDRRGYDFWVGVLDSNPENYLGMVCSFVTSREYQLRFSSVASRSNAECGGQ